MAFAFDVPFCLTPVSADGRSPVLSPHQTGRFTPVRLVCSISAISAVVHAIIAKRIQQGDDLRSVAVRAARGGTFDLATAALVAPAPQLSVEGFERAYYCAQFAAALSPPNDCPFTSTVLPDISIQAYISRLLTFSSTVSNACYILMVGLLDKAVLNCPKLFLHSANAHRLILSAFVVATKYHEDCYIPNADFARFGGVTVEELNKLEAAFLKAVDWRCYFSKERFDEVEMCIVQEALDTARGLTIFQTLRAHHIAGLDEAVRRTRSWSTMECVPMSPVGDNADPSDLSGDWVKSQSSRLRALRGAAPARAIVAGIARALGDFHYPEVPMFPSSVEESLRRTLYTSCYPRAPRNRMFFLQTLASGIHTSATVVPAMFDFALSFPSAAVLAPRNSHVTPFASSNYTSISLEYGSSAKASVHYLLNDIDPFEDLNPAPIELPAPCSMMATMERECGLEGLL